MTGFGVEPTELLKFAKGQRAREDALDAAAIKELGTAVGKASEDTVATAETYASHEDANRDRFGGPR